jgi:FkbM family methyltransferase
MRCCVDFEDRTAGITTLSIRGHNAPISLRNGTSDFAVFKQVFIHEQYNLPAIDESRYIVDAGANIGLTSLYLLLRNPNAQVIAVEPDSENLAMAAENLAPFRDRCCLIQAAVWSQSGTIGISRGDYRDGRHWATRVETDLKSAAEEVPAMTIHEIMEVADFKRIDFLKMDIEGAELQVFRDGETSFLDNTLCCAVECHDQKCSSAFGEAVHSHGFSVTEHRELSIATRNETTELTPVPAGSYRCHPTPSNSNC